MKDRKMIELAAKAARIRGVWGTEGFIERSRVSCNYTSSGSNWRTTVNVEEEFSLSRYGTKSNRDAALLNEVLRLRALNQEHEDINQEIWHEFRTKLVSAGFDEYGGLEGMINEACELKQLKPYGYVYNVNYTYLVFSPSMPPEDAYDEGSLIEVFTK